MQPQSLRPDGAGILRGLRTVRVTELAVYGGAEYREQVVVWPRLCGIFILRWSKQIDNVVDRFDGRVKVGMRLAPNAKGRRGGRNKTDAGQDLQISA